MRATILNLMYVPDISARAIHDRLVDMVSRGEIPESDVPSLRSIYRGMDDIRLIDNSDPWHLADAPPEEARLVLDVLADVIILTNGSKTSFTKTEASWVLRIRTVAPDIEPCKVWGLARQYMLLENKKPADMAALDHYLAFRPWVNANRFGNYAAAVHAGWIEEDPSRLWDIVDRFREGLESILGRPQSLVDSDPALLAWWRAWKKPRLTNVDSETEKKLQTLEKQNPELAQKILDASKQAQRIAIEYLKSWYRRGDGKVTEDDRRTWESIFAEVYRMLDGVGVKQ